MTLKQQWIKEFDEKFTEVEFLHGVPVNLPKETRQQIKDFISSLLTQAVQEEREKLAEIQRDIDAVLAMLEGDTDRQKIANHVREYLQ